MLRALCIAAVVALSGVTAVAAPPLVLGDVVIHGVDYAGYPSGACDRRLCRVDPAGGPIEPISDLLPNATGEVAIESATSALVLSYLGGAYAIERVNLATGSFALLASGLPALHPDDPELTVAPGGRIFLVAASGIIEIDRTTGAVMTLTPGEWHGLDAEPDGRLLTTRYIGLGPPEFPTFPIYEFVRIDPTTGVAVPLGETVDGHLRGIEAAASGDRFGLLTVNSSLSGMVWRWRAGVRTGLEMQQGFRFTLTDLAAAPDGTLIAVHYAYPGSLDIFPEFYHYAANGGPASTLDYDFGIGGVDVMLQGACSDGIDNDGDGAVDHPADIGCQNIASDNENPRCDDGIDNDGDGKVDWDGAGVAASDPNCSFAWQNWETPPAGCGLGAELALVLGLLAAGRRRAGRLVT